MPDFVSELAVDLTACLQTETTPFMCLYAGNWPEFQCGPPWDEKVPSPPPYLVPYYPC